MSDYFEDAYFFPWSRMVEIHCYIKNNSLECMAALFGVLGGFFFPSVNNTMRIIGAILWGIGNVMWIIFAHGHKKWALFALQFVYMAQNIFAVWNVSTGGVI
jgi:hypothetical protein